MHPGLTLGKRLHYLIIDYKHNNEHAVTTKFEVKVLNCVKVLSSLHVASAFQTTTSFRFLVGKMAKFKCLVGKMTIWQNPFGWQVGKVTI